MKIVHQLLDETGAVVDEIEEKYDLPDDAEADWEALLAELEDDEADDADDSGPDR